MALEQPKRIEAGDSVKFGKNWCKHAGRKELINKTVMMKPLWFEVDNGIMTVDY